MQALRHDEVGIRFTAKIICLHSLGMSLFILVIAC